MSVTGQAREDAAKYAKDLGTALIETLDVGCHIDIQKALSLIEQGASLTEENKHGQAALSLASSVHAEDIVRALLARFANVAQEDCYGATPLLKCGTSSAATAQLLIDGGADLAHVDHFGGDALYHAAYMNNTAVAEALIKAGADPARENWQGKTARHWAEQNHNAALLALIDVAKGKTPATPPLPGLKGFRP